MVLFYGHTAIDNGMFLAHFPWHKKNSSNSNRLFQHVHKRYWKIKCVHTVSTTMSSSASDHRLEAIWYWNPNCGVWSPTDKYSISDHDKEMLSSILNALWSMGLGSNFIHTINTTHKIHFCLYDMINDIRWLRRDILNTKLKISLFEIMKIFCLEDLFWFQSYWVRDINIFMKTFVITLRKWYGRHAMHTELVHKCDTSISHNMLKGLLPNVTYNWFPIILRESWRVQHVRKEMITLSGTPDFIPFDMGVHDFTHSLYMYIHCIICQSRDYVYGLITLLCLPELVWLICLGLILL